jgi:CubicO group peptidase (beta-lactamase class C family)
VGIAWDKGLIPSIDEPVSRWYPEISGDPLKSQIRIRHLLNHTSGIFTTKGSHDIYPQSDFVAFALNSDMVTPPGHVYRYNNRAINIASGIVRKASGQSMNNFLVENLFRPLGIEDFRLQTDRAGNGWGMDGAQLRLDDLAKIGTVLANGGRYQDQQIISQRWLDIASQAGLVTLDGSPYGLGLFALDLDGGLEIPVATVTTLERSGLRNDLAKRLLKHAGQEFPKAKDLGEALKSEFNPAELEEISSAGGQAMVPIYRNIRGRKMISHSGEIGIILIAVPEFGLSVARTIDESRGRNKPHGFENIYTRVFKLLPPPTPLPPAPK